MKRPIVEVGFWTFLPIRCCSTWFYCSCFPPNLTSSSAAFSFSSVLSGFLRPQETTYPLCLFPLSLGWRRNPRIAVFHRSAQPWSLRVTLPAVDVPVLAAHWHEGEQRSALLAFYGWNWKLLDTIQVSVCLVCSSARAVGMQLFIDLVFLWWVFLKIRNSFLCLWGSCGIDTFRRDTCGYLLCKLPSVSYDISFAWRLSLRGDRPPLWP